jgi:hypothetical protein
MSWVDHIEGRLPADDLRRAFVEGALWWLYISKGNQMPSDDLKVVEAAAEARYPGGKPPPSDIYHTPDSILAIVSNPPYVQTDSYAVLRETCPTLDADDAPDPEEDV